MRDSRGTCAVERACDRDEQMTGADDWLMMWPAYYTHVSTFGEEMCVPGRGWEAHVHSVAALASAAAPIWWVCRVGMGDE